MDSKQLRIVFMGTPELAAHILQRLVTDGYQVVAVVTAPDRPAGRGRRLRSSPVKDYALEKGIPVLQPEKLRSDDFLRALRSYQAHIQVVVAFRMLPEAVWSLPPLGTFNLHASLLPDYRGAAPINWAIINGEKRSGVTTFLIDHKIDTGNILFRKGFDMEPWETAGSLHEKVKKEGAALVTRTIEALSDGSAKPVHQDEFIRPGQTLHKAPKIHKEDCRIDWTQSCENIAQLIHGLSPSPGAFCELDRDDGRKVFLKLHEVRPQKQQDLPPPGSLISDNKTYLHFSAADGLIQVMNLQMEGKKRMSTQELLRGSDFSHFKKARISTKKA